jgi:hypothetical protein
MIFSALPCGQRHLDRLAVVLQWRLACPHLAAHLDVFLDALHWLFVRDSVETLDDLRPRGPESEDESTIAHEVTSGSRHSHQCGGPRVHVHDAGSDLDAVGLCGQVPDLRDGIEAVRLCDPHLVQSGLLERDDSVDGFLEPAGIVDSH